MIRWRLAMRMLARNWHAGEQRILVAALVIAVAASTNEDRKASYSDYGEHVWVTAPSGGGRSHSWARVAARSTALTVRAPLFAQASAKPPS